MQASRVQGQGYSPDMVVNEVNDLIDFVVVALRHVVAREVDIFAACNRLAIS